MTRLLRTPGAVAGFAAAALFSLMCLVPRGGLLSDEQFVDLHLYRDFSSRMLSGLLPYRDFFVEYPPGSIPVFIVPGWISQEHYQLVFRLEMAAFGAVAVAVAIHILARAGAPRRRLICVALVLGLLPLALGPVLLNGYDLWPTLLLIVGVAFVAGGRETIGGGILGVAAIAKIFPVVILPIVLIWAWRRAGRPAVQRCLATFAAAVALVAIYWVAIAPGGVGYSFQQQFRRGLQDESLGASGLFVLDKLGVYTVHLAMRPPGSLDVIGSVGNVVGGVTTLVEIAAILWVAWLSTRVPRRADSFLLASAAALCAFVAFGKVFSPQYLVWLAFVVPLVGGASGAVATALLAAAIGLTQVWVLGAVKPFELGSSVWFVVVRNALVVLAYVVLARELSRRSRTT